MRIVAKTHLTLIGVLLTSASPILADTPPPPTTAATPQTSPPPLSAYGELPGIEEIALSPNGKGLAIVSKIQEQRRLVALEGGTVRASADVGNAKIRGLSWAGDDKVIVETSSTITLGPAFTTSRFEASNSIAVPLNGQQAQQIFALSPSIATATWGYYGARQIDGKWVGYFGGIELERDSASRLNYYFNGGAPALFQVDLNANSPKKIARAATDSHWRYWALDENGTVGATFDIDRSNGQWVILNSSNNRIASGTDPEGDVGLVSFGEDGTTIIYAAEDNASGQTRWYEVPLAGGTPQEIFAGVNFLKSYIDPTNNRLLGYLPNDGNQRPVLFNPDHQRVLRSVYRAFPNLHVTVAGWTPNFSHVLVNTSGNNDSGTWYVVDMAKLRAEAVGYDRTAIDPEMVGAISTIPYHAADGTEMDGILTLPPGKEPKNLPVIMLPHGGPHDYDTASFNWWAQAFASRGYAVFQPNFRGSTNRTDAFRRAGYGQWGRKMQTDISDGLAELAKRGIVDPKRACIVGGSYGGYAALAGVTLQQGLYRCAVAVAPVSDLSELYYTDIRESGESRMTRRALQESLGDPKSFAEVSPRRNAAKADAPVMIIHGKDDTVVPFRQGSAMVSALQSAGKPVEMVTLREEDHWLSRAATRQQMLEASVSFVQKNNPAN